MRPRLPAAAFEPAQERLRKEGFGVGRHGPKVGRAAQGRKSRGIRLSPLAGRATVLAVKRFVGSTGFGPG